MPERSVAMSEELIHYAFDVAPEGSQARACNEDAFRHLLAVERARAARLHDTVLLMLVRLRPAGVTGERLAERIFDVLNANVREADVIGWLRDGRVAAVVLAQCGELPSSDVPCRIGRRLSHRLAERISLGYGRSLQVRVLELQPAMPRALRRAGR